MEWTAVDSEPPPVTLAIMANSKYGPFTIAAGATQFYWFAYMDHHWEEDDTRSMFLMPRAHKLSTVSLTGLSTTGVISQTNTFAPYTAFNMLVENKSGKAATFSILLTPFK